MQQSDKINEGSEVLPNQKFEIFKKEFTNNLYRFFENHKYEAVVMIKFDFGSSDNWEKYGLMQIIGEERDLLFDVWEKLGAQIQDTRTQEKANKSGAESSEGYFITLSQQGKNEKIIAYAGDVTVHSISTRLLTELKTKGFIRKK